MLQVSIYRNIQITEGVKYLERLPKQNKLHGSLSLQKSRRKIIKIMTPVAHLGQNPYTL